MQQKPHLIRDYTFKRDGQEVTVRENELTTDDLNLFYEELISLFKQFPIQIQKTFIYDIIADYERLKPTDSGMEEPGQE